MALINKKIGECTVFRRTEFSKLNILDEYGNVITKTELGKEILDDYNNQEAIFDICFEVYKNEITGYTDRFELKNVFIPDHIDSIKRFAFEGHSLKRISIPETVWYIGKGAFYDCKNLIEISLPDAISSFNEWDIFNSCMSLKKVKLPKFVDEIPRTTFNNCVSLEEVILPCDLKIISESAFHDCESLEKMVIPDSVEEIWTHAFAGCKKLKEINMPKNINKIGMSIFAESGIKTLIINHDIKRSALSYYSDIMFKDSKIENIVIDGSVKLIESKPFEIIKDQIKKINFLGSKSDYEQFQANNKDLCDMLNKAKIEFDSGKLEEIIENKEIKKENTTKNLSLER